MGYQVPELRGKVRELNELRARKGPTHVRGKIESSLTRRSGCASVGTTTEHVQMDLKWVWFDYSAEREYVIGRISSAPAPVLNLLGRSCESLE